MEHPHKSEVARFREQNELETQAFNSALNDPASIASHAIIAHRNRSLEDKFNELSQQMSPEEAMQAIVVMSDAGTAWQRKEQK